MLVILPEKPVCTILRQYSNQITVHNYDSWAIFHRFMIHVQYSHVVDSILLFLGNILGKLSVSDNANLKCQTGTYFALYMDRTVIPTILMEYSQHLMYTIFNKYSFHCFRYGYFKSTCQPGPKFQLHVI